jgi:hypothetical protein
VVRIAGSHPADPGSSPGLGISFASVASVASFRIRRLPDHSYACPTHESHTSDEPRSAICDPRSAIRDPRSAIRNPQSTIYDPRSPTPIVPYRIVSYRALVCPCVCYLTITWTSRRSLDVDHFKRSSSSPVPDLRSPVSGLRSPVSGLRSPVSGLRSPSDNVGAGCRATLGASCCRPTRTPESPRPEARGPRPDASIQNPESRIQHPASNTHLTFYLFERNRSIASDGGASEAVASRRALIVDS